MTTYQVYAVADGFKLRFTVEAMDDNHAIRTAQVILGRPAEIRAEEQGAKLRGTLLRRS